MFPCAGQNVVFSIISRISQHDLNTIANLEDLTSLEVTVFIGKEVSEGMVDLTNWEQGQVTRVKDFVLANAWGISITHKYENIHLTFVLSAHYSIFGRPNRLPQGHFVCVGRCRETK